VPLCLRHPADDESRGDRPEFERLDRTASVGALMWVQVPRSVSVSFVPMSAIQHMENGIGVRR
jgi:hypothetical protein